MAARLFHSQFQIVFSSAESGRISGQADLHIFYPNVSVHPRRTLCAVVVERLVGSHFHWLFLASLSEIVPAGFVTFVSQWWRVHCARGSPLYPDPTSAFTVAPLVARKVERLVGPDFFIFLSGREGEGRKWAENAQNWPVRAVRGHFGPIFHHFSVLEASRGHFCIIFS